MSIESVDHRHFQSARIGYAVQTSPPEDVILTGRTQSPANPDVFWVQHHNGIYRSVDGSKSWQALKDVSPSEN